MKLTKNALRKLIIQELTSADLTRPEDELNSNTEENWNWQNVVSRDAEEQARKGQYGNLTQNAMKKNDTDEGVIQIVFDVYNWYEKFGFKNESQVTDGFLTKEAIWMIIDESSFLGLNPKEALNQYYLALSKLFQKKKTRWQKIFR